MIRHLSLELFCTRLGINLWYEKEAFYYAIKAKHQVDNLHKSFERHVKPQAQIAPGL